MCKFPVEFTSLGIERAKLKRSLTDASYGHDLGIIPGGEDLISLFKILVGQGFLNHRHASLTEQSDHSLSRNPRQEGSVWDRRQHSASFRHEHIGGRELRYVSQHVADNRIVESPFMCFEEKSG